MTQKIYPIDKIFVIIKVFLLLKNTFKVALHYFFNGFILFIIVFNLRLNFKLKIKSKMCTFKNLEEIWKSGKSFEKTSGNPF